MKKELLYSLIGYLCLIIVGSMLGLWIYTSTDSTKTYEEVQRQYLSYFPTAIANGRLLCLISIGIAGIGIFAITMANKSFISKLWLFVNTIVVVLLWIVLGLNVFSLM